MNLHKIENSLHEAGFISHGAFHPEPEDGVPNLDEGRHAGTLVVVGNAGPGMWRAFTAACDPDRERLDDWTRQTLSCLAAGLGAWSCFPFDRPYRPFQRWARMAGPCHVSPLGIMIHPSYGLWHGYRGALIFSERLELPPTGTGTSPCEACSDKPCLTTCPVGAFMQGGYDVPACAGQLASPDGADCMNQGCRARRACPVGRDYWYTQDQARFHMESFLRNHR